MEISLRSAVEAVCGWEEFWVWCGLQGAGCASVCLGTRFAFWWLRVRRFSQARLLRDRRGRCVLRCQTGLLYASQPQTDYRRSRQH